MKEKDRLILLGAILAACLVAFCLFGYLCYRQGQGDFDSHPACTCDMIRNHECPPH